MFLLGVQSTNSIIARTEIHVMKQISPLSMYTARSENELDVLYVTCQGVQFRVLYLPLTVHADVSCICVVPSSQNLQCEK